jgi:hypothetical protein
MPWSGRTNSSGPCGNSCRCREPGGASAAGMENRHLACDGKRASSLFLSGGAGSGTAQTAAWKATVHDSQDGYPPFKI